VAPSSERFVREERVESGGRWVWDFGTTGVLLKTRKRLAFCPYATPNEALRFLIFSASGPGGRRFKSSLPDQSFQALLRFRRRLLHFPALAKNPRTGGLAQLCSSSAWPRKRLPQLSFRWKAGHHERLRRGFLGLAVAQLPGKKIPPPSARMPSFRTPRKLGQPSP